MKVMKFGGVLLNNTSGFDEFIEILKEYEKDELVIVVSAFSNTTKELLNIARLAEKGNDQLAYQGLNKIIENHIALASFLINSDNLQRLFKIYNEVKETIMNYLKGVFITNELTARTTDIILSYGEYLAIKTYDFILNENKITHSVVDSKEIIVTNDEFNEAVPLVEATQKRVKEILLPELSQNKIILTQGFVAKSLSGEITTMGIESSNLTATLIAETLDAEELIIWTDVEGIFTADPKLTQKARFIPSLDYQTALIAALNGLKLIYPAMIDSAKRKGIKIIYRSAINPKGTYTVISDKAKNDIPMMIIVSEKLKMLKFDLSEISHHATLELMTMLSQKMVNYKYFSFSPDTLFLALQIEDDSVKEFVESYPLTCTNECNIISIINPETFLIDNLCKLINNKKDKELYKIEIDCPQNIMRYFINGDSEFKFLEQLME